MEEKMIKCPICHRTQPESLGACDFCEELRQDGIDVERGEKDGIAI